MEPEYIGDGVYVCCDKAGGIEVRANDFDQPTDTIYFEPEVIMAFIRYAKRIGIIE